MKKNPKAELMRIIAYATVIGPHIYLPSIVNDSPDTSRVLLPIFWLMVLQCFC